MTFQYFCPICNKAINCESNFIQHYRSHKPINFLYSRNLYPCKICGERLVPLNKTYCSNKCKHSDPELNVKRARKEQNDRTKYSECNICGQTFNDTINASGILSKHLRDEHNIQTKNFNKYFTLKDKPFVDKFVCPICKWDTIDIDNKLGNISRHLRKVHKINPAEFVKTYPQYSDLIWTSFNQKIKREKELSVDSIECKICGEKMKKISNTHLQKHNISIKDYKRKYKVSNTCSETVSKNQSKITLQHNYSKGTFHSDKKSLLELDFKNKLIKADIQFDEQHLFNGKKYDFKVGNFLIEIDGIAYHPFTHTEISFTVVHNKVNDYSKRHPNLFRIHWDKSFDFNSEYELFELLKRELYVPDYSLEYKQKILTKEYLQNFIEHKGKEKLNVQILLKFIRTFQPSFPYPPTTENLSKIIQTISTYDLSRIKTDFGFNNNISSLGNSYLKSNFKSFWNSSFRTNPTPVEAWSDDKLMKKIIEYRIGLNNSGEVFDFNLYQLIKGMSARKLTVSFFKPLLAASIYDTILTNKVNPKVLDPCCGFGGRLLGFMSRFPNGTYVGCEPNIDTYNELINLKTELVSELKLDDTQIQLYNCKFEDFKQYETEFDVVFTSIPYFDLEKYSNEVEYDSFNDWSEVFIGEFYKYKNVYINMNTELCSRLELNNKKVYSIKNNRIHFSKSEDNQREVIIKLN